MMATLHNLITHEQIACGVPRSVLPSATQARQDEMETDVDEVAAKLAALGYDPLIKLVEIANSDTLSEHQKASINKWLMPYRYPQKRAVELTGKGGGAIPLVLGSDDAEL